MKLLLILLLSNLPFKFNTVKILLNNCCDHTPMSEFVDSTGIDFYRLEINRAVSLLKTQKQIIDLELNKNERVNILSIAFPEIIRYNSFSDFIETLTNQILYINKGKQFSDFSIGYFQMKPSFVENLEDYVSHTESLQQYNSILIQKKNKKEARKERIERLENFQWQIRYLKVFWYVAELKYKNLNFKTEQEKIRFYATAYNYGFEKPQNEIVIYQTIKIFPYGKYSGMEKFAFADFSIDFIDTYSTIFN